MSDALIKAGYPAITLPDANRWPVNLHGRNINHGYQRGWGLEYGDLSEQIKAHPLFQEAFSAASTRGSLLYLHRIQNLFLLLTCFMDKLSSQNCIEFGVYRGGSTLFMATVLKALYPAAVIYALDTYEGMPITDGSVDLHSKGDFADTSLDDIRKAAIKLGLANIMFVQGLVEDTFPSQIPAAMSFGLAHIDLDIYLAIRHCQKTIYPRMSVGGYVVYDDATVSSCIGATQAVEEFVAETNARSEQIYPHFVFRAAL
jgi:hypothetical protein